MKTARDPFTLNGFMSVRSGLEKCFSGRWLFPRLCLCCQKTYLHPSEWIHICPSCAARLPWRRPAERYLSVLSWRLWGQLPEARRQLSRRLFCLVLFRYEQEIPYMLRLLKFHEQRALGRSFGEMLGSLLLKELGQQGRLAHWSERSKILLLPIPLAKSRSRERGYNQAADLTEAAACKTGLSWSKHILLKQKETERQSEFQIAERLANLDAAFTCLPGLEGRNVVVIDDILTSGATLFSALESVLAAGASSAVGLVVASGRHREPVLASKLCLPHDYAAPEPLSDTRLPYPPVE